MRVLLIEDEARIVELLSTALSRAGFVVDAFGTCADGGEALALTPYDAAILDLGLTRWRRSRPARGSAFERQRRSDPRPHRERRRRGSGARPGQRRGRLSRQTLRGVRARRANQGAAAKTRRSARRDLAGGQRHLRHDRSGRQDRRSIHRAATPRERNSGALDATISAGSFRKQFLRKSYTGSMRNLSPTRSRSMCIT